MKGDPEPEPEPSLKRLKTPTHIDPPLKTNDGDDDASSQPDCCGICLYEGGAIRGEIDSCSHFFCFICIMEWAKVESRCPLCKRRFGSIRRASKPGLFPTQRVVIVPVRDQIYHISGNATIGPPDPYSNVRCSVCNSVGDENLLLLCDLCDTASHTHCVGLGATVPEGDWFCHDCSLSKAEHDKIEEENKDNTDETGNNTSIDDIVRQSRPGEVNFTNNRTTVLNMERNPSVATRTLGHCRNVHIRVKALRENWNSLRSGSISFTSSSIDLHTNRHERLKQSHFTSTSNQQVPSGSSSCDKKCSKSSYDVDKAWKMMNKAKSMKQAQEKTKTVDQSPKHLLSKINNPFEESRAKSLLVLSSSKSCAPQNHQFHCSSSKGKTRHKVQKVATPELSSDSSRYGQSHMSSYSQIDHETPSSRKFYPSVRSDFGSANGGILSRKHVHVLPSENISKGEESVSLPSPPGSLTATSVISSVRLGTSSSHKTDLQNGIAHVGGSVIGNEATRDDPKSDIQVLVKLSLKLLVRNRKLDVKMFKEIARLATHSILAACGLEEPRPGVRSFPTSVCWHTNQTRNQRRMSTLMPNCCRECFHVFVKDVVNSIMVDRVGSS